MRNIKMTLAYDGTNYHGFQIQKGTGLKTVQEELEKALGILTQEEIAVIGSGRTDAGVHAEGQVINFISNSGIPADKFPLAANSLLPRDIVIWQAEDIFPEFHARFNARGKTYRYTIYNHRQLSPFWRFYAYHVPVQLDIEKMIQGGKLFLGTHDFRGFCAKDTAVKDFTRTIFECSIQKDGPLLTITVTGDGFLYNMVRIMVGTLLEIGQKKRRPEEISALLSTRERKLSGTTLPPQGLCLCSVQY